MAYTSYVKDPDAVLDYRIDWSQWLTDDDTIVASVWAAAAGITIDSSSFVDTATTVWLSGGSDEGEFLVTNHITTDQGREEDRSILIKCKEL